VSSSERKIKTAALQFITALVLVLGLLGYEGYPLLSDPPETVEIYDIYEGLEEFINYSRNRPKKSYFVKVQGLSALVWPTNDEAVIKRLRKTRHNSMLRLVLEKQLSTNRRHKPDHYYRAVAIYANNRIYDHQSDPLGWKRQGFKQLVWVMSGLLGMFGVGLYQDARKQPAPETT
jgi:hypothetical protein